MLEYYVGIGIQCKNGSDHSAELSLVSNLFKKDQKITKTPFTLSKHICSLWNIISLEMDVSYIK